MGYNFRRVDPRSDEDMSKYVGLIKKLSDFCNDNQTFDEEKLKWMRVRMGAIEYATGSNELCPIDENSDEMAFVCEHDGDFVGFIDVAFYHVVDGERPDDDIGIIHDMYVDDKHRGLTSFTLLKMAVDSLLSKGKNYAICNVQEDNPNRFLHFALANNNVVCERECKRRDGSKTMDYTLLIDLHETKDMTILQFAKKLRNVNAEKVMNKRR